MEDADKFTYWGESQFGRRELVWRAWRTDRVRCIHSPEYRGPGTPATSEEEQSWDWIQHWWWLATWKMNKEDNKAGDVFHVLPTKTWIKALKHLLNTCYLYRYLYLYKESSKFSGKTGGKAELAERGDMKVQREDVKWRRWKMIRHLLTKAGPKLPLQHSQRGKWRRGRPKTTWRCTAEEERKETGRKLWNEAQTIGNR